MGPLHAGTQISDVILDIETAGIHTVKGFATIDQVALINVEVRRFVSHLTLPVLCHLYFTFTFMF